MRRVLASGGTLGLIWNGRDESVPWVAVLSKLTDAWAVDWPVQSLDALPEHRNFDQGSYLRIGRSELRKAGGVTGIRFELFLTSNDDERTLFDAGNIALTVKSKRLSVSCARQIFDSGVDLPQRTWLDVSLTVKAYRIAVGIRSRDVLAPFSAAWTMDEQAEAFGDHDILLGSDAEFARRCLNARFASIAVETPQGFIQWQFPTIVPDGAIASVTGPFTLMLEGVNLPTFCVASEH
jgi:N,N-dimethylformamidase